ncbi:4Fe-4S dicluster domain-containing protein [Geoalkalibacter sp.]|uniref:4Fe-4S dicluster domain-containing protein n=1 Tax=Geoalkalibacter sp. TaxID=3041440 RepID=UPI00272E2241|nr:4Fe-4S dicluster domain-containing protein [Geoalkalibacter sp.]
MRKADRTGGRLGPWRRSFQWATSLLVLGIPFVRIGGDSLLRLDPPSLTLYLGGRALPIEELYLFLLLGIALILLFLLVTLAFGRAWCGWACPQTTLSDLTEGFRARIGLGAGAETKAANLWRRGVFHLFCLALALLTAANLVWYFLSPYEFFARLAQGRLGMAAGLTLAVTAALVYLDLAWVRRLLCREFCPYGRFQSALVDPGTLTLRFHPDEASRCIRCGACVRACPMDIDIRRGDQIECINCGRCLDACRDVMARRGQAGIIRYTFGLSGRGAAALLNPRMLLVTTAFVAICAIFAATLLLRTSLTLKLGRPTGLVARPLDDGQTLNFFLAVVANRGSAPLEVGLRARAPDGSPLRVLGPVAEIHLAPRERRRLDFAVVSPNSLGAGEILLTLESPQGQTLVSGQARLAAPLDAKDKGTP